MRRPVLPSREPYDDASGCARTDTCAGVWRIRRRIKVVTSCDVTYECYRVGLVVFFVAGCWSECRVASSGWSGSISRIRTCEGVSRLMSRRVDGPFVVLIGESAPTSRMILAGAPGRLQLMCLLRGGRRAVCLV